MEEELLKRNTDCVYFLASPLTCKKGAECEYRHSEMARLNPRDCWYWLSGTCLNPTCAFRHPPLESPAQVPSESASVPSQATQPTNKTAVPCFFYFQGFCSKGDTCTFSHVPEGSMSTAKSSKAPTTNSDAHPVASSKTSTGNKTVPAPTEVQINQPATAQKSSVHVKLSSEEKVQLLAPDLLVQNSSPIDTAETDGEKACVFEPDTVLPPESYNEDRSDMGVDWNLEDHVDDVEPEEPWESSPGFDVLVDNSEEENLCYEDDQEYYVALDRKQRVVNDEFVEYDFEETVQCERLRLSQSRELDLRDHLRKRRAVDEEQFSRSTRRCEQFLPFILHEPSHLHRRSHDEPFLPFILHEPSHLHRRSHDRPYEHGRSERNRHSHEGPYEHGRSERNRHSHETPYQHGLSRQIRQRHDGPYENGLSERLRGRLVCDVGRTGIEPFNGYGNFGNGSNQHSQFDRPRLHRESRDRDPRRKPFTPFEFGGKPVVRERRPSGEFSRPKSLAQIRREKRRGEGKGYHNEERDQGMGGMESSSADFEGPKPLNEILKEKRKVVEV